VSSERRRYFNQGERRAIFLAADGRCEICGGELDADWEADHRIPFAHGGATSVENGQATCSECNRKKGDRMPLRDWQDRFVRDYAAKLQQDYLLVATPAAGKTRAAGEVARRLLDAGRVERVIVIVPTVPLKVQWRGALHRDVDLHLRTEDGKAAVLPRDFDGFVATYQAIAASPDWYRRLATEVPALVILDEIHHCADDECGAWGPAIRRAFGNCVHRLALSGTPFRTQGEPIPFVTYGDGVAVIDHLYDYVQAMRDGVCRPISVRLLGGEAIWLRDGAEHTATFDEEITQRAQADRLRTAVEPATEWVATALDEAIAQLDAFRLTHPDAGGLVLAPRIDKAQTIARLLEQRGIHPVVVTSDDDNSRERLEAFRSSSDPWAVAVNMVSEGVDIPRLRVGVWATYWRTELFFRQVVGRFVRAQGIEHELASLFIPDDPTLRANAQKIREQVEAVLLERKHDDEEDHRGDDRDGSSFAPLSATAESKGTIFGELHLTPAEIEHAERVKAMDPETALFPTEHVARLLRNADTVPRTPPQGRDGPRRTREEELKLRRTRLEKMIRQIALTHPAYVALEERQRFAYATTDAGKAAGTKQSFNSWNQEQLDEGLRWASSMLGRPDA
jgi:superfamily II DNA or RNA helicase